MDNWRLRPMTSDLSFDYYSDGSYSTRTTLSQLMSGNITTEVIYMGSWRLMPSGTEFVIQLSNSDGSYETKMTVSSTST
jgi:hypothetical protein